MAHCTTFLPKRDHYCLHCTGSPRCWWTFGTGEPPPTSNPPTSNHYSFKFSPLGVASNKKEKKCNLTRLFYSGDFWFIFKPISYCLFRNFKISSNFRCFLRLKYLEKPPTLQVFSTKIETWWRKKIHQLAKHQRSNTTNIEVYLYWILHQKSPKFVKVFSFLVLDQFSPRIDLNEVP